MHRAGFGPGGEGRRPGLGSRLRWRGRRMCTMCIRVLRGWEGRRVSRGRDGVLLRRVRLLLVRFHSLVLKLKVEPNTSTVPRQEAKAPSTAELLHRTFSKQTPSNLMALGIPRRELPAPSTPSNRFINELLPRRFAPRKSPQQPQNPSLGRSIALGLRFIVNFDEE